MKSIVRRWPFWVEFALVMVVAFGPFIFAAWKVMPHGQRAQVRFDDVDLLGTGAVEVALGLGLAVFLKMRGYTRADFPFRFGILEWGRGIEVLVLTYVTIIATAIVAILLIGEKSFTAGRMDVTVSVSLGVMVSQCLVNALYEELFVTGYILRTLEKLHGLETAIVSSVFVRFLYHVYQGPQAIFSVIPIGFVFALYFARTRNLWPIVLAHALVDIISFSALRQ